MKIGSPTILLIGMFAGFACSAGADAFTFTTINYASIFNFTVATGINNLGQIVGWYDTPKGFFAFSYNGGIYTTLTAGQTSGINDSGQILYPNSVNFPSALSSLAIGINNADEIVGYYSDTCLNTHGFLDSGGTFTSIDHPLARPGNFGDGGTYALGINNAGQIAGFYIDSSGKQNGFLYNNGTFTTINFPSASATVVSGINDVGQIVGYYLDASHSAHGFLGNGHGFISIDHPLAVPGPLGANTSAGGTLASAINDEGQIVGYYYDGTAPKGFLATPVPVDLTYTIKDLCAPKTCIATLLNDRGRFAGSVDGILAIFSDSSNIIPLEIPPEVHGVFPLAAMNNDGVVVGTWLVQPSVSVFSSYRVAAAWVPTSPTAQALTLNSVFGWSSGTADYINNKNEIVGNGTTPLPPLIPGVQLSQLLGITDSGNIIGVADATYIYTPGLGTDHYSSPFTATFRRVPVFNSRGQLALVRFDDSSARFNPAFLYTPGKGLTALPSGMEPLSINDSGLLLCDTPDGISIYDSSGTIPNISVKPIPLSTLIPPDSGWQILRGAATTTGAYGYAINNLGQILVQARNDRIHGTQVTSIVLTPSNLPGNQASATFERSQRERKAPANSRCLNVSLNGLAIPSCPSSADRHQLNRALK